MGLVRQSATTFATRILITVVNIPISIMVARTLGVDGQGVYAAAVAFPNLWSALWLFGLDAAHTWSLASGRTSLGRVLGNTIIWLIIISALAVPTYLLAARFLDAEKVRLLLPVLGITALVVPLVIGRYLLLACFLGLRRIDQYNILSVVSQVLLLAILVVVLLIGNGGTRGAVWAYFCSLVILAILAIVWVMKQKPADDPVRPDTGLMKSSLSYGIRGYGTVICGQITYRFDQLLVPHFVGMTQQGYYSIAVLLAEKLAHITNTIQLVLFPTVSASSHEEANKITPAACRHALFWVGLAAVGLYLIRYPLIRIPYGTEFLEAAKPFSYLLIGVFLLTFSKVLTVDLSGRNRRFPSTVAMGIAMVVNLTLNFIWIPKHGMLGAAWSSAVSYGVQSFVMILFFLKISGVPFSKLVIPERGDVELYRRIFDRLRDRGR